MVDYIAEWTQLKYDLLSWKGLFLGHNTHVHTQSYMVQGKG